MVIGHRGAAKHEAENTIASMAKAIELGASSVEADLCVTSDGRVVLWHDEDPNDEVALARQVGMQPYAYVPDVPPVGSPERRRVSDQTFAEFVARHGYSCREDLVEDTARTGERPRVRPSSLEELFAWANGETRCEAIYLDCKLPPDRPERTRDLCRAVRALCCDSRDDLRVRALCPHHELLEPLRAGLRDLDHCSVCADFELPGSTEVLRATGVREVSLGGHLRRLWPGLLRAVGDVIEARQELGVEHVVVWTVNRPGRMKRLVDLGVDGIITDEPASLLQVWQDLRERATVRADERRPGRTRDDRSPDRDAVGEQRPSAAGP